MVPGLERLVPDVGGHFARNQIPRYLRNTEYPVVDTRRHVASGIRAFSFCKSGL